MRDLVSLSKADMKKLGIVDSKDGILIDRARLAEIKKFQRKPTDDPTEVKVKKVSVKDMVTEQVKQEDHDIGIF